MFGAFSALLVLVIHPVVDQYTRAIPDPVLHAICIVFVLILLIDILTTVGGVKKLNRILRDAAQFLGHEQWLFHRLGVQQKRMLVSFPALISTRYNQALLRIRQALTQRGKEE